MNSETGEVLPEPELMERLAGMTRAAQQKWRMFEIGEEIEVKGIKFRVHEVGDQRLVLKFKR